jgi:hypothetical protein
VPAGAAVPVTTRPRRTPEPPATRLRASIDQAPAPSPAIARKPKQYSRVASPLFSIGQKLPAGPSRGGQCFQKYATAISPEAMKAAIRVKKPTVINSPATSSIRPAHQNGHAPTSIGPGAAMGQSNSFWEPCSANIKPATMRKTLSRGEE